MVEGVVDKSSSKLRIALLPRRSPDKENLSPFENPTCLLCLLYCYPLSLILSYFSVKLARDCNQQWDFSYFTH